MASNSLKGASQRSIKSYVDAAVAAGGGARWRFKFGIAYNNLVQVKDATVSAGQYAVWNSDGLESKSATELKTALEIPELLPEDDFASNDNERGATQRSIKNISPRIRSAR